MEHFQTQEEKMTGKEYCEIYKSSRDKAYDALFTDYCDYVYAIVYNKLRCVASREDIEECVSDIFADVFFGYDTDNGMDKDMKGYIGTVAKRRAINTFYSLSARNSRFSQETEEALAAIGSETDIEADSDKAETRSIIIRKINELGEPDSTIILQKYYYDRSSSEIAELLSMKSSAVRMRASRALEKLRHTLADVGIIL
jgi:RNA polymerase sigma-70 factor (ECF subfamily)